MLWNQPCTICKLPDMLRPVRPCLLAGFGIRSQAVPGVAAVPLIRTHHSSTFPAHSDVVPLTTTSTRKPRSSHLKFVQPLNSPRSKTITTTGSKLQQTPDEMAEPTGLIAKSGIELLTFG